MVPTNTTVRYKYSKICMEDDRPSADTMGFVLGVGVLIASFAVVFVPDVPVVMLHLMHGVKQR